MRHIAKRYFTCLIFTFDLAVLVGLSEIIRLLYLNSASNYTIVNVSWSLLWFFVIIPLSLVSLWRISAVGVKKLFVTFGLAEASLGEKEKIPTKTEREQPEETDSEKLKNEFRNRATYP